MSEGESGAALEAAGRRLERAAAALERKLAAAPSPTVPPATGETEDQLQRALARERTLRTAAEAAAAALATAAEDVRAVLSGAILSEGPKTVEAAAELEEA